MPSAIHELVLQAVATRIRELALPGLAPERVYARTTPDDSVLEYPHVIVSVAGLLERTEPFDLGKTAARFRTTWPVLVLTERRGDVKDQAMRTPHLEWRGILLASDPLGLQGWRPSIVNALRASVEPGANLSGLVRARTEPGQTSDPQGPAWLKIAGALVVWVPTIG
jgi:hypothetical protein